MEGMEDMKVTEAEAILGMGDMTYDTATIGIAYMRALRTSKTAAERKKCDTARSTLERYVTSMKKSGQFGTLDKVSAAMSTASLVKGALGRHHADGGNVTGTAESDGASDQDADRLAGRRRYPKSGFGSDDGTQRMPKPSSREYMKSHYAQARGECRPKGDGNAVSFRKAALMTLWDATPWRWFMSFWAAILGVLMDALMLLGAVPSSARAITIALAMIFWVGVLDRATGLLWTRAMPASARAITRMR